MAQSSLVLPHLKRGTTNVEKIGVNMCTAWRHKIKYIMSKGPISKEDSGKNFTKHLIIKYTEISKV